MHISNDRYFLDRERHDLALRMIGHEARTCTIRACTGLTDDRIRRLYKTYASHVAHASPRRRRGKSPRIAAYFVRTLKIQYESSLLASTFVAFGLHAHAPGSIEFGRLFCDAFETHRQLFSASDVSFEHAWCLMQLLLRCDELHVVRCRRCDCQYLLQTRQTTRRPCPVCKMKGRHAATAPRRAAPLLQHPVLSGAPVRAAGGTICADERLTAD